MLKQMLLYKISKCLRIDAEIGALNNNWYMQSIRVVHTLYTDNVLLLHRKNYVSNFTENLSFLWVFYEENIQ